MTLFGVKLAGENVVLSHGADEGRTVVRRCGNDSPLSGDDSKTMHEVKVLGGGQELHPLRHAGGLGHIPADVRDLQGSARRKVASTRKARDVAFENAETGAAGCFFARAEQNLKSQADAKVGSTCGKVRQDR